MVHLHERRLNRTLHSTDVQSLYSAKFLLRHDYSILNGYTLKGFSYFTAIAVFIGSSLNGCYVSGNILINRSKLFRMKSY